MVAKAVSPIQQVINVILPAGTYDGIWGGYEVKLAVNGQNYSFLTDKGVRGTNIPVTVKITNESIVVETKPGLRGG